MSSLLFIVLLRENKVLVLLWQAYYPSRSGSLLVNMDYWSLADLLFLLLWLSGWWGDGSFRSQVVLLAVAVQVCVLELLVLRAALAEEVEVAWERVPAGRNWARLQWSTKLPVLMLYERGVVLSII